LIRARSEWFAQSQAASLLAGWSRDISSDPVIAAFDDEWSRYPDVGTTDHAELFAQYFDLVPTSDLSADKTVLDAGAGAGRWAFEVSRRGPRVVAVDLGRSIEITRANTSPERVACVQADLEALPLAAGSVDWAYSLGVLHHTRDPEAALAQIVKAVRPGGTILLYLYYALDQRGPLFRGLFRAVDLTRRFLSRQPRAATRVITGAIALFVYWPLARSAAILERAGAGVLAARVPLSFYRHLSFKTMRNDSLDRFGTPVERRYTRRGLQELMRAAGLDDVRVSESMPFWHATGVHRPTHREP
jgi:SAM-dependent methyltransferase